MHIGEALAEARGRAGLTVTEVSQRTRIRETIIREIEDDNYSACGGDFYARGNIRNIAKAVGADPEPLIREYDTVHRAPGAASAVSLDELLTPAQTPRRGRLNWAVTLGLGLALVVALGLVGYTFFAGSRHAASTRPTRPVTLILRPGHPAAVVPSPRPTAPARTRMGPVAVVRAYITAINDHRYARAWRVGGRNVGESYSSFVAGFSTTARDTLTIVSVSGDVVTARLTAQQTDGTVHTYQGTYTIDHGVIVGFHVLQVG